MSTFILSRHQLTTLQLASGLISLALASCFLYTHPDLTGIGGVALIILRGLLFMVYAISLSATFELYRESTRFHRAEHN